MVLWSFKARVKKGDAFSAVKYAISITGALIVVALTCKSIQLSMLVTSDATPTGGSSWKAIITSGIFAGNFTVGREPSDITIYGHAAFVKDKKSVRTAEDVTLPTVTLPAKIEDKNTSPSTREICFPHNSEAWLQGPRLGNHDEPLMNDDFVKLMTLELPYMLSLPGKAKPLLGQTIAFESSRFVDDSESGDDPKSMRLWAVRLIYLSMLYHQHVQAIPEAEVLYGASTDSNTKVCQKEREALGIGRYDFECPNAKYIIASLSNNGLGANMRGGATTLLIAGLITGRVVLFVNNSPNGDTYLQKPWELASCDRKDTQCFFLPPSPCTITHKDIEDAYKLEKKEQRLLFKKGMVPDDHKDDKVIQIMLNFQPVLATPKQVSESLHNYSKSLIDHVPETDPRLPVMKAALDHLLDKDVPRLGYNFAAANIKLNHALNFYAMRPNLKYSAKMDEILAKIIPDDFEAENSFGLPIRGEFH
jgi:hypothetical protein